MKLFGISSRKVRVSEKSRIATAEVLAKTRKSQYITGAGRRMIKSFEFNCDYKGFFEVVKDLERDGHASG